MHRLVHRALLALLLVSSMSSVALAQETVTEAEPAEAPPLKAAVVVAGDPDDAMRAEAARVDALVETSDALIRPGDPGLRQALRGEIAEDAEDGLERARAERRRLGWNEEDDGRILLGISRMSGARILLVLRRQEGVVLEVFDVEARAFYQGALPLGDASDAALLAYLESRAAATRSRASGSTAPPPREVAAAAAAAEYEAETDQSLTADDAAPADDERWIRHGWPYIVAGALLAGLVVALVVTKGNGDDQPPPVLRFRPGGG